MLEDRRQGRGRERVRIFAENKGDDTVPEESGRLPGTEVHPIAQHRGALHVDADVKMRLELELAGGRSGSIPRLPARRAHRLSRRGGSRLAPGIPLVRGQDTEWTGRRHPRRMP